MHYTFALIIKANNQTAAEVALRRHETLHENTIKAEYTQTAPEEYAIKGQLTEDFDPTEALETWYADDNDKESPYPMGTLLMWTTQQVNSTYAASPPRV